MALLFCDSFDHYATADIALKWTSVSGSTITANGRNGTSSLRATSGGQNVTKTLSTDYSTLIAGTAFKVSTLGAMTIIAFLESSTLHVDVRLRADGKLDVTRNGTVLGTSSTALATGGFYYVEFKSTIHDSTGVAVVKINGTTEINLSSQDTRNGGTGVINVVRLGPSVAASNQDWDDFYLCDTSGSAPNNDFLGDVRVQAILPNGNGNSSQLTGSDGNSTDNYLLVDESTPNSDTDYVESATTGQRDTYAFGNVTPTSGTVFAVQVLSSARKTDAGSRNVKLVARPGSTNYSSAAKALLTTYAYHSNIWETNPDTSSAWTISEVNASEFGVEVA